MDIGFQSYVIDKDLNSESLKDGLKNYFPKLGLDLNRYKMMS